MILQLVASYGLFAVLPPLPAQFVALVETGIVNIAVLAIMARAYVQTGEDDGSSSHRTGVLNDAPCGPGRADYFDE